MFQLYSFLRFLFGINQQQRWFDPWWSQGWSISPSVPTSTRASRCGGTRNLAVVPVIHALSFGEDHSHVGYRKIDSWNIYDRKWCFPENYGKLILTHKIGGSVFKGERFCAIGVAIWTHTLTATVDSSRKCQKSHLPDDNSVQPQTLCLLSVRCNFGDRVDRPLFCAQGLTDSQLFKRVLVVVAIEGTLRFSEFSEWMPWILPCCAMAPWCSKRPLFWSSSFCWSPSFDAFDQRPSPFSLWLWPLGSPSATRRSKAGGSIATAEIVLNSMRCDASGLED